MSELILHAAHLSEAHQLRFSYLFNVAAKRWRASLPESTEKPATELWVIDANSAPDAISERPDTACVLLIATDDQADALRDQWPNQIDAQLPPDYSVGRLTQMLEQISLQAHSKRVRESLKNRRTQGITTVHNVQVKNADAVFLKATQIEAADAVPAPGTRFRIKRWTQLIGSMAGQPYRQALAALISGDRTLEELQERSTLERAELLRLLQVLRGKSVLTEIAPPVSALSTIELPVATSQAAPQTSKARGLFRQLSRWIGQTRGTV
ncbi:MAG: hypothetical protein RSD57_08055 [Comamonas sp.]